MKNDYYFKDWKFFSDIGSSIDFSKINDNGLLCKNLERLPSGRVSLIFIPDSENAENGIHYLYCWDEKTYGHLSSGYNVRVHNCWYSEKTSRNLLTV